MIDKFFMWWLEEHYIWSTILTPFITFMWCVFKGDATVRAIVAFVIWVIGGAAKK